MGTKVLPYHIHRNPYDGTADNYGCSMEQALKKRRKDLEQCTGREDVVKVLTEEHPKEKPLINLETFAETELTTYGAGTLEEVGDVMVKVLYEGKKTHRYDTVVVRSVGNTELLVGLDAVRFEDDGEDYYFLMTENIAPMSEIRDFGVRHPDGREADDYEYIGVDYEDGFLEALAAKR